VVAGALAGHIFTYYAFAIEPPKCRCFGERGRLDRRVRRPAERSFLKDVPGGTPATAGEDARAPRNREIAVEIKKRKPAVFPKAPSIPLQKIDKTSKSGRILHVNECECAASAPRRG